MSNLPHDIFHPKKVFYAVDLGEIERKVCEAYGIANSPQQYGRNYGGYIVVDEVHRMKSPMEFLQGLLNRRWTYEMPTIFYLLYGQFYKGSIKAVNRNDARGEIKRHLRNHGFNIDRLPAGIVIEKEST